MNEKKRNLDFAIDPRNDGSAISFGRNDSPDGAAKKMNRRLALLYIIFPIIAAMCVLFYFTYLDIRDKLGTVNMEGAKNVQSVSKEFETKISALADRYAEIKKSIDKKNKKTDAAFNAHKARANAQSKKMSLAISDIASDLEKNMSEARAMYLEKTLFTDALKKTGDEIKAIGDEIQTIGDGLDRAASQMNAFQGDISRELSAMKIQIKDIRNDLILAQADITSLATDKVAQKAFRTRLAEAKKSLETDLEKNIAGLNKKAARMENQIKALGKARDRLRRIEQKAISFGDIEKRIDSLETKMTKIDAIQSEIYFQKQETAKILKILSPAYPDNTGVKSREIIESDLPPN